MFETMAVASDGRLTGEKDLNLGASQHASATLPQHPGEDAFQHIGEEYKRVAESRLAGAMLLATANGELLYRVPATHFIGVVNCVALIGSDRLATGSNDSCLKLWMLGGDVVIQKPAHTAQFDDWVMRCAASPADEALLVVCANDRHRRQRRRV